MNVVFNHYSGAPGGQGAVDWTIDVWGSTTDPGVRLADDPETSELTEPANDLFNGSWSWNSRTHGGVIGELSGGEWVVSIEPQSYGGLEPLTALRAYDRSGTSIALSLAARRRAKAKAPKRRSPTGAPRPASPRS